MTEAVPQRRTNATELLDWRNKLLAAIPQSPLPAGRRAAFRGVPVAPYDPRCGSPTAGRRRRARQDRGADGHRRRVPFERAGVVHLPGVGDLDVWWLASYGGGIFVPIKDARTDGITYPGGRYVIDTVKGADLGGSDGSLVVDLNFAYNPSCAYDPSWACPLAPPGNTVQVEVTAGELMRPAPRWRQLVPAAAAASAP